METLERYRELVQRVLEEYAAIPYANGDYERELIIDRANDRYLLLTLGWEGNRRVYYPVLHIDIRDGKLWIQHDATEAGVATDLIAAGVPKECIVLAFYPPEVRQHSEFAVA
jgi:hypothetical protein